MATLRQFEMPDQLFHSIERRAGHEGLSVAELVVREMTEVERIRHLTEDSLLDEIRRDRALFAAKGVRATDELIRQGRDWGRE